MQIDQVSKDRILDEEVYRIEVKKKLESPRTDSNGTVSKFLNSSFGLWLLSAVFISGAGTIYQNWQKALDTERVKTQHQIIEDSNNQQAIERLDIEISFRLSQALLQLSSISELAAVQWKEKPPDKRALEEARMTSEIVRRLGSAGDSLGLESLYSEYASYSLLALMAELRRRLPGNERSKVERSLASLAALAHKATYGSEAPAQKQAAASLFKDVVLQRWQGTAFHYIDCNVRNPFC